MAAAKMPVNTSSGRTSGAVSGYASDDSAPVTSARPTEPMTVTSITMAIACSVGTSE